MNKIKVLILGSAALATVAIVSAPMAAGPDGAGPSGRPFGQWRPYARRICWRRAVNQHRAQA